MTPANSKGGATRREHDLLGDRDVPADAYYGVHTLRAMENFAITGIPISIKIIEYHYFYQASAHRVLRWDGEANHRCEDCQVATIFLPHLLRSCCDSPESKNTKH